MRFREGSQVESFMPLATAQDVAHPGQRRAAVRRRRAVRREAGHFENPRTGVRTRAEGGLERLGEGIAARFLRGV